MNYLKQIPLGEHYQLPPPGYSHTPFQEEEEVNLRDYWKVIQKRRWTIIAFLLITVIATAVASFTMIPIFRGTTTIQINKENPQIFDFKEIFAINTADMDYYQTQYKILETRTLARRVIQSLKLQDHPEFLSKPETPFQKWKSTILNPVFSLFSTMSKINSYE